MSSQFYTPSRVKLRQDAVKKLSGSSKIDAAFFETINANLGQNSQVLDIGTGNGFIAKEIYKRYAARNPALYGLDISEAMIALAETNFPEGIFSLGDNFHLPFSNGFFNMVTAKNVTQFSPAEVFRVLAREGMFVFREYGLGKGLVEIAEMFPGRLLHSRPPSFYVSSLENAGFKEVEVRELRETRKYTLESIRAILHSFPFIEGYSKEDEQIILAKYGKSAKTGIEITSDPILITGRKRSNG